MLSPDCHRLPPGSERERRGVVLATCQHPCQSGDQHALVSVRSPLRRRLSPCRTVSQKKRLRPGQCCFSIFLSPPRPPAIQFWAGGQRKYVSPCQTLSSRLGKPAPTSISLAVSGHSEGMGSFGCPCKRPCYAAPWTWLGGAPTRLRGPWCVLVPWPSRAPLLTCTSNAGVSS